MNSRHTGTGPLDGVRVTERDVYLFRNGWYRDGGHTFD